VSGTRVTAILACALATAGLARPSHAAPARFPKGAWSVGADGGIAFLTMADINEQIRILNAAELTRFEEFHHGGEWAVDVRYGVAKGTFLGLETGGISAVSHDQAGTGELKVRGTPVILQGGATIDEDGSVAVRVLGGAGALVNARFEEPGHGQVEGSTFMGYIGAELEVRVAGPVGITAQGLGRTALLSRPENAPYNVDFSGGSIRAGLHAMFGGRP
jgi:hypothetical protein